VHSEQKVSFTEGVRAANPSISVKMKENTKNTLSFLTLLVWKGLQSRGNFRLEKERYP